MRGASFQRSSRKVANDYFDSTSLLRGYEKVLYHWTTVFWAVIPADRSDCLISFMSYVRTDMPSTPSKASSEAKKKSRTVRAGLQFPVGRIQRQLKKGRYAERIGSGGPIYLAAVMEYLIAEILELAGNAAQDNRKSRITPHHVMLAVRNDEELSKLFSDATFAQGGVIPNIHSSLLPAKHRATDED
ncbi:hypothetical protein QR680_012502 [Steinernema hermaphroditum]|uniref:Histone H2A n=1 Tax=Steinernema hermaphroditum TaxID=289476 RepID=A0AA39M0V3_9BILA|nr:hypothetical protein QR680_012502 [Steinernema hermaphroditum]